MNCGKTIYGSVKNPLLLKTERRLPQKVAMVGAGAIGPDIGYYLKSALSDIKVFLDDVVGEPLKKAGQRRKHLLMPRRSDTRGWEK